MNDQERVPVESLLQQMSLQKPSEQLDKRIRQMLDESDEPFMIQSGSETSDLCDPAIEGFTLKTGVAIRRQWLVTISSSLAAAIAGVFIGWAIPGDLFGTRTSSRFLPGSEQGDHSSGIHSASRSDVEAGGSVSSGSGQGPTGINTSLNGSEPRIVEEGFQILDGKPSRVYRVEGQNNRTESSVRKKIIVPSSEI